MIKFCQETPDVISEMDIDDDGLGGCIVISIRNTEGNRYETGAIFLEIEQVQQLKDFLNSVGT